jgi:hypothetical protein
MGLMSEAGPSGTHVSSSPSSSSTRPASHSPPGGGYVRLSPQTPLQTPLDSVSVHAGSGNWGDLITGAHPTHTGVDGSGVDIKPPTPFQPTSAYTQPSPVTAYGGPSPVSPSFGQPQESPVSASAPGGYSHTGPSPPAYLGGAHVAKAPGYSYAPTTSQHQQRHSLPGAMYVQMPGTSYGSDRATAQQQASQVQGYTSSGFLDSSHAYAASPLSPSSAPHDSGVPSISHLSGTTPTQPHSQSMLPPVHLHAHGMPYPHRRSVTEPYAHAHSLRATAASGGAGGSGGSLGNHHGYMAPPGSMPSTHAHSAGGALEHLRPSPPHALSTEGPTPPAIGRLNPIR